MKKLLLLLLIASSVSLMGCKKDDAKGVQLNENKFNATNNIPTNTPEKPFTLTNNIIEPSPFLFSGSDLIFPNWDDNNKISTLAKKKLSPKISTSAVDDFVEYPTNYMAISGNDLYFSNGNDGGTFSKINLKNKAFEKINNKKAKDITSDANNIFYIDYETSQLFSYDINKNDSTLLTSDKVGKYIINGDFIIFQNASDKHRLYKMKTDGTMVSKLTDYSADSFVPYEGNLIFINSSDDDNLYMLNPKNLETKRLAIINGEDLRLYKNNLLYINRDDSNYIYSLKINKTDFKVTQTPFISEGVNKYFTTPEGVFYQKRSNVNNAYYFKK